MLYILFNRYAFKLDICTYGFSTPCNIFIMMFLLLLLPQYLISINESFEVNKIEKRKLLILKY